MPDWKMAVAKAFAAESTCVRRKVGAALFYGDELIAGAKNTERFGLCETDCPRGTQSYAQQPAGVGYPPQCAAHAEELVLADAVRYIRVCKLAGHSYLAWELVVTDEPCPEICYPLVRDIEEYAVMHGFRFTYRWERPL